VPYLYNIPTLIKFLSLHHCDNARSILLSEPSGPQLNSERWSAWDRIRLELLEDFSGRASEPLSVAEALRTRHW